MKDITTVPAGGRVFWTSLIAGLAGIFLTLVAIAWAPQQAFASYLCAYCFWVGIALGCLLVLMANHASSARWIVVVRRFVEAGATSLPLLALLFIPIALGLPRLYPWASPGGHIGEGAPALLAEKAHWLAPAPFLLRSCAYFVVWIGTSEMLYAWSRRQDSDGDVSLLALQRRVGAGALPLVGMAMTFAAFDWLMSLQPTWGSTIFGVYWFAGSFLGAHAIVIVAVTLAKDAGLLEGRIQPAHFHSLGKWMFAFVCFWAYIAFSQFMLVWIANRPDEVSWYAPRVRGPYLVIALSLVFGKFVLPFFVLLSRSIKPRPHALSAVALYLLGMQYLDIYWLIMPSVYPAGGGPRWTDFTAFVGVGGACTAFALWRMQGARIIPARDPYLEESVRYKAT